MRTDIRHSFLILTMLLLLVMPGVIHAQQAAGITPDRATRVLAPVILTVQSGSNYIRLESEHLPPTVTYVADTAFGPLPMALVMGDTLEAQMVFDTCHMAWRWSIEEAESDKIVEIKAHENASIFVDPYVCQVTTSDTTATACGSYEWRGQLYDESGDYSITLTNAAGCDSIRTLHLTVFQPTSGEENETACNSYEWNGKTYTESGDYTFHTTNVAGCDSTATLHLTIHRSYAIALPDTAVCETEMHDGYVWHDAILGDTVIHDSGIYTRRYTSVTGCDSTVTQKVKILQPTYSSVVNVTAYDSYTSEGGVVYTKSVMGAKDYLVNAAGCDSIVTFNLTIRHLQVKDTFVRDLCASELPYEWYGKFYHESGIYSSDTIQGNAVDGVYMDSVHLVNLTILPLTTGDTTATACESFKWHGKTYTESGDYTFHTTNKAGCDSTVTLHLTIHHPTSGEENRDACISYEWHGQNYTQSGNYIFHLTNVAGCDSTATLHLTIHHPTSGEETKTACNSYDWNGKTYTESGDYTFYTTNVAGCDSTVTLHLTLNDCSITYDTVYFCAGQNTEHEEKVSGDLIRRYLVYEYESPAEWNYMEGVILSREKERMQVDLRRAEENLYAHYVDALTPVKSISWSYRADGTSDYRTLEVANEPQWIETGTIAVTVRFVCGQFYTSDFEADIIMLNGENGANGQKVLENGQIIILRGGKKYNIFGLEIND